MATKVTSNGIPEFRKKIRLVQRRVQNPSGVWPKVGQYLSYTANRQFVTEGVYLTGKRWAPLKPDYRLRKLRAGLGRKILVGSGDMKRSLTSRPMDIEIYAGSEATFGSSDPKVIWHHHGTHRNGKRVNPPRPIMPFNREVKKDVAEILKAYVRGEKATWR